MEKTLSLLLLACSCSIFAQTLQQQVHQGLNYSPAIQSGVAATRAEAQGVKQAYAKFFPSIDVTAGFGREESQSPTANAIQGNNLRRLNRRESKIEMTENLFAGGDSYYGLHAAKHLYGESQQILSAARMQLALDITEAYLNVLQAQLLLRDTKNNFAWHSRLFRLIKQRTNVGVSRNTDRFLAEERLAKAHANYIQSQTDLAVARVKLKNLSGLTPHQLRWPQWPDNTWLPQSKQQLCQLALSNNPELAALNQQVKVKNDLIKQAAAKFYPQVDAVVSVSKNQNLDGLQGLNNDRMAMLRLRYQPLNGGADIATLRKTRFELTEIEAKQRQKQLDIKQAIAINWANRQGYAQRIPLLKRRVNATRKTRKAFQQQYDLGKRPLIDLLDVETDYVQAKAEKIRLITSESIAQFTLLKLVGRLIPALTAKKATKKYSQ